MEKFLLPIFMFLLIYAPKIGGTIDSLSLVCAVVFVWSSISKGIKTPRYLISHTIKYVFFGIIMLSYSLLLFSMFGLKDTYQILRFGRVIINILGIFGLVRIYFFYYKENLGQTLLYHLWLCIVCHALIMVLMFLVPAINDFVLTQLVQLDVNNRSFEDRMEGNRIGGLTGSWDAASGIQSLGVLLIPFILAYRGGNKTRKRLIYLTIPLTLWSIFISGVTGLVIILVIGFIFFVFYWQKLRTQVFRFVGVLFFILLVLNLAFNYTINNHSDMIKETSIGRTLFMITQNDELSTTASRGSTATETIDKIGSEMYFLPDDTQTFFFGKGGSGRVGYTVKADTGPTLNLHNLGIFFIVSLYLYCFHITIKALKIGRENLYIGMGISAVALTILIIDFKVAYLLARQSLSIMLIAYFSLFWYNNNNNKSKIQR